MLFCGWVELLCFCMLKKGKYWRLVFGNVFNVCLVVSLLVLLFGLIDVFIVFGGCVYE